MSQPPGGRAGTLASWVIWALVGLERLLAVGLLATVLGLMAAQVVARYVLQSPIAWSEEAARFALIWLAFLAAAFVMADGRHIAVDLVSARLGPRGKLLLETLSNALVVATCVVLVAGSAPFVLRVGLVHSPSLEIAKSWWYAAASVGLSLIALHGVLNTVYAWSTGRPVWDADAEQPADAVIGGGA